MPVSLYATAARSAASSTVPGRDRGHLVERLARPCRILLVQLLLGRDEPDIGRVRCDGDRGGQGLARRGRLLIRERTRDADERRHPASVDLERLVVARDRVTVLVPLEEADRRARCECQARG